MRETVTMEVSGYVVRFCGAGSCAHNSSEGCPNATDTKYYIDPEDNLDVVGVPLVVAHNKRFVVGKCISQVKTAAGLFLRCVVDDAYFLESLRRRFDDYKDNYNSNVTFETFCKKTLSSFSLSHEVNTKVVRHVSLVDTPGRQGTTVDYETNLRIVLKRRAENQFISDIVASHSAAYLPTADRTSYLLKSTSLSHNPNDVCYINASRNKMDYQDQFSEATEIYKIYKALKADREGGACLPPRALKRNRKTEDDGCDNEDEDADSSKKRKVAVGSCATEVSAAAPLTQPMVVEAMRNGVQEGITAALEIFKQQQQQFTPPPPAAPVVQQQPTSATTAPIIPQASTSVDPQVVDAGRARATITLTPDQEILNVIVKYIMGDKPSQQ